MRDYHWVLSLFMLMSCATSEVPVPDLGLDYFPLKVGDYQIYLVDETQISLSVETKFKYELKVRIVDSLVNQEGGYTYIIQRQKRTDANFPWVNLDSWTARVTNGKAIVNEGNTSLVKATFPIQNGLEWDGNAFNTLGGEQYCGENKDQPCDLYRLENVGNEFTVPEGAIFGQTVSVVQNENTDLIVKQDVRSEVYAKGVGLIYKESVVLEYCTKPSCLGQQKIDKGFRYKQRLKEYGSD